MNQYDGMHPDQYERDLLDMGADPEDARAAAADLQRGQDGGK